MRSLLLLVALAGYPCLAAEVLTEYEIQDIKDLHRERLAEWLLPRVGEDSSLMSWQDLKALTGKDWNDLTRGDRVSALVKKLERDQAFQEKIEKAFADWKKRRR